MERAPEPRVRVERSHCPYCKDAVLPEHDKAACATCMAFHHAECWETHGSCSACGAVTVLQAAAPSETGAKAQGAALGRTKTATSQDPAEAPAPPRRRGSCAWIDCERDHDPSLPERPISIGESRIGTQSLTLNQLCRAHAQQALRSSGNLLSGIAGVLGIVSVLVSLSTGNPNEPPPLLFGVMFVLMAGVLFAFAGSRYRAASRLSKPGQD